MTRDPLTQYEVAGSTGRFKVSTIDGLQPAWRQVPDKVWNDPNTIVERKLDGHRFKLHVSKDGNRLDSRKQSVNGGLYVEKTDHAPRLRDFVMPELDGTILDGEIVAGKDSNSVAHALGSHATDDEKRALRYVVFDIIAFKGEDMRTKRDDVRRALLEMLFQKTRLGKSDAITLITRKVGMTPQEKKDVLMAALVADEEGVMIKDTSKPYGKGWTKVKREARYDVIVVGYAPPKPLSKKKGDAEETITKRAANGWVGAIKFGQYVAGTLVEFGQTSGMDDATLQEISENKETFLGRVFEISAQERFPTGKFRHPRFERWRDDKPALECIYREDEV